MRRWFIAAEIQINITGGGGGGRGGGGGGGGTDPVDEQLKAIDRVAKWEKRLEEVEEKRRAKEFERSEKRYQNTLDYLARQKSAEDKQRAADDSLLTRLEVRAKKQLEALKTAEDKQRAADDLVLTRIEVGAKKKLERMAADEAKEEARQQKLYDAEAARNAALIKKKADAAEKVTADEAKAVRNTFIAAAGGAAAAIIRGGGLGATLGGAAGTAIGSRFGPAGAAIAGAIGEKAGGGIDKALPGAGSFGARVARGEGVGIAADAVEGASRAAAVALLAIPGAGIPAALAVTAFGKTVGVANEVLGAFATRARELSGYSGSIAGGVARQDVTRLLNDIREGQRLGEGYAKLLDKQTELEETLKAGLLPIKEVVIGRLPQVIDLILDGIIGSLEALSAIAGRIEIVDEVLGEMKKMRDDIRGGSGGTLTVESWLSGDIGRLEDAPAPRAPGEVGPVVAGLGLGGLLLRILPDPVAPFRHVGDAFR